MKRCHVYGNHKFVTTFQAGEMVVHPTAAVFELIASRRKNQRKRLLNRKRR